MPCIDIFTPKTSPFSPKTSPFSPLCIEPDDGEDVLRAFEDGEIKAYEDGETVLVQ